MTHGASLVLQSHFDAAVAIRLINETGCTLFYGTPNMVTALIESEPYATLGFSENARWGNHRITRTNSTPRGRRPHRHMQYLRTDRNLRKLPRHRRWRNRLSSDLGALGQPLPRQSGADL